MKKIIAVVLGSMLLGAIALYTTHWSLKVTSTNTFCVSCHSMQSPHLEWQGSVHYSNAKGIRAGCADCHIPHDNDWNYFKTKVFTGLKDVAYEFMGKIPDVETFEAKRAEMAQNVWRQMQENDSVTCRSCHDATAWDYFAQSEKAATAHLDMQASGETCIDCHRGVAHFPPEFGDQATAAAGKLHELAEQTAATAKTLFPIEQTAVFADEKQSQSIGRIFPSLELKVVAQQGEMRQVSIDGYQQQGAEQVLYAVNGKRIIGAVVDSQWLDNIQPLGDYQVDTATGSYWRPIRLTVWVSASHMLDRLEPLWAYGNELNNAYCGGCHAVIPGGHFSANQWPSIVNGMTSRTSMDEAGQLVLTYYLQHHGKDMGGMH